MHQRKATSATISHRNAHSNSGVRRRVRRKGRIRQRTESFEFPMHHVLLPLMVLFAVLWIRMLFQIASRNLQHVSDGNATNTSAVPPADDEQRVLFRLHSEEAPVCNTLESPREIDVTLVTQLSDDRLWMMKHHCERYAPHPMSIAVYSNATQASIAQELKNLGCRVKQQPLSQKEVTTRDDDENTETDDDHIVVAKQNSRGSLVSLMVLDAQTHGAWNNYPVNELRNIALKGVQTTHMVYIDVDFWPSEGLYESLTSLDARQRLWEDPKLALVVPAFQLKRSPDCEDERTECRDQDVPRMPRTLSELRERFLDRKVQVFDATNIGGHGSTDYKYWFEHQTSSSASSSLHEIPCLKSHRYEPFVALRYCRSITPPFQSVFSGYGKNKMTWTMQVAASGFVFAQVGGAYLVHYPHAISKSREHWNEAPPQLTRTSKSDNDRYNVRKVRKSDGDLGFSGYHRGHVDDLYLRFKEWLERSIPESQVRTRLCKTAQDDDGKLWVPPDRKRGWNRDNENTT